MRTPEQITDQLKSRLAQLEQDAANPTLKYSCETCRFYSMRGEDGFKWGEYYKHRHTCTQPLVKGFAQWGVTIGRGNTALCGPEKALWERPVWFGRRLFNWFIAPWVDERYVPD